MLEMWFVSLVFLEILCLLGTCTCHKIYPENGFDFLLLRWEVYEKKTFCSQLIMLINL